jgi:DNA polymerase-3 subunit chi
MTQVDFYVLKEASDTARLKLACRLIEQAFGAGQRVLAWTEDDAALESFDNLLWTFGERAFVPHEMLGGDPRACEAPVQLAAGSSLPATAAATFDVLVNLRATAVPAAVTVARVIEVIDGDEARRQAGRERFRSYRERGLAPSHHNLDNDSQIGNG